MRWYLIVLWFVFPWWWVTLSIFSCVCWPSGCLLWKSIYSFLLTISSLDYLFLGCGVWWVLYRFWILALCPICHLQISVPICKSLFPLQCRSFLSWWGPSSSFLLCFPCLQATCLVRNCCGRGQRGFFLLSHGPRDRDLAEVGCLTDCATQAPLFSHLKQHYENHCICASILEMNLK